MMVPLSRSFTRALFAHFTALALHKSLALIGAVHSEWPISDQASLGTLTARGADRSPQHHRALPKRRLSPPIEPIVSVVSRTTAFRELALEDRQYALHAPLLVLTERSERAGVDSDELPQQPLAFRPMVRAAAGDQLLDGIDVCLMNLVRASQGHGRASSPNPISPSVAQMSALSAFGPRHTSQRASASIFQTVRRILGFGHLTVLVPNVADLLSVDQPHGQRLLLE